MLNVQTGGIFENKSGAQFAGITGGGNIVGTNTSQKTLTLAGSGNYTFSGNITQALNGQSLTKIGSGTQTLTGNSSYTGDTTVSGGTLTLNRATGSLASGKLVFGGTGTFNMDNVGATGPTSQSFGNTTLTFTTGDATIMTTRSAAFDMSITVGNATTRTVGGICHHRQGRRVY